MEICRQPNVLRLLLCDFCLPGVPGYQGDYSFRAKIGFNQELIKPGKIAKAEGILFNKLFSLRQEADYEDFAEIQADEIQPMLPKVKTLILEIDRLIKGEDGL